MRFAVVLLLTSVLACNSLPTETVGPFDASGQAITLSFGQTAQFGDLRVSFRQVVEDSRCPATVQCVWMGNGKIRLDVSTSGGTGSVLLNTAGSGDMPREASTLGYTFKLEDLQPYPQTTDSIPPTQYSAAIRITRTR